MFGFENPLLGATVRYALFIACFASLLVSPHEATSAEYLTPRGRPPAGWTRLEWPEKRAILFGQFAPTDGEKQAIDAAMPTGAAPPVDPPRVLIFYRCQYPHASIATGVYALEQLGEATGAFRPTLSEDPADFNPATLAEFDAVLLIHTTSYDRTIGPSGQAALADFMQRGKGLVGIHAAADASAGWSVGADLMGGVFRGHPWLPRDEWAIKLESPDHPLNAAFGGEGFWLADEIYIYRPGTFSRTRSRVLLSLDMAQAHNRESKQIPERMLGHVSESGDYPIAWLHERGGGRVFYSNLGHSAATFREPAVLRHYLDGVLYACGRLSADATPSAELSETATAPAPDRE
ncbi:Trehalose utilization [Planctomycetes bacterium MalM25]|nr:Trehalose utilization [Planctomycetes bacterium MalM25]